MWDLCGQLELIARGYELKSYPARMLSSQGNMWSVQ